MKEDCQINIRSYKTAKECLLFGMELMLRPQEEAVFYLMCQREGRKDSWTGTINKITIPRL